MTPPPGTLHVLGVGPGDPELLTLKAARLLGAAPVVAFFAKHGRPGHARGVAGGRLRPGAVEERFAYPFTTELPPADPRYQAEMAAFYERCAARLAVHLGAGRDVALLCEGDPFFYGSSMYLLDRLRHDYPHQVVPGVTGMSGCWSAAGLPFTHGDDVLCVLPGTLDEDRLTARLECCDAAVIMKVGRNLPKIRRAVGRAGLAGRAVYVECGTQPGQRVRPLEAVGEEPAPYFSLVLVPGRRSRR